MSLLLQGATGLDVALSARRGAKHSGWEIF